MRTRMNLVKLSQDELKEVRAGVYTLYASESHVCGCGCYYATSGGSSTENNGMANYDGDLFSPQQA